MAQLLFDTWRPSPAGRVEKMGYSLDQIASELRLSLEQVGRHLKALAEWRRSREEEAGG